jgi:hypothetical protein
MLSNQNVIDGTDLLLKQVIEAKIQGQIEVTRKRGRRRKKLLDDLGCEPVV